MMYRAWLIFALIFSVCATIFTWGTLWCYVCMLCIVSNASALVFDQD